MADKKDLHATPWYYGSPTEVSEVPLGSTITQDKEIARVFSHKPSLISIGRYGSIYHNGHVEGFIYQITEPVQEDSLLSITDTPLPSKVWRCTRVFAIELLERTAPDPEEMLTLQEEETLRQIQPSHALTTGDLF